MSKPISPDEVEKAKALDIPEAVVNVFNKLIVKNWNGSSATVKQKDAVNLIVKESNITRDALFNNNWLDVEGLFREAGWRVEYDKPGYNESYEAYFVFKRGKS